MKSVNILLFGGGLDSYAYSVLLNHFNYKHILFHVDYGQRASEAEIMSMMTLKDSVEHIFSEKMEVVYQQNELLGDNLGIKPNELNVTNAFIIGRNLHLIQKVIMSVYSKTDYFNYNEKVRINILLGFVKVLFPMPDASFEFINCVNRMASLCYNSDKYEFCVSAPLQLMERFDVVNSAFKLNSSIYNNAMTCWVPVNNKPCNECIHCKNLNKLKIMSVTKDFNLEDTLTNIEFLLRMEISNE